jgi:hypothetical protein
MFLCRMDLGSSGGGIALEILDRMGVSLSTIQEIYAQISAEEGGDD